MTSWSNARSWNANVGAGEVDDELGVRRDLVDDLEVEHGLAVGASGVPQFGSRLTVSSGSNGGSPNSIANLLRSVRLACGRFSISGNTIVWPVPSRFCLAQAVML